MPSCWAARLGGCSQKISREHLVSESLFSELVDVQGFPWCKDKPTRIGLSGLTAKILCVKHNNDLSPIDTIGGKAFETLQEVTRLSNVREKKKQVWTVKKYRIDGKGLECWFLKTLIDLCCDRSHAIGRDSVELGQASDRLVRMAYGLEPFTRKAGLYSVAHVGMNISSSDVVQFAPIFKNNLNVEAGFFVFRGWNFPLFLEDDGPTQLLSGVYINGINLGQVELSHHPGRFNFRLGHSLSHSVLFDWR
jgi:hypothetical protein